MQTFTIYRSSAGSGKTRTLAKEYLKLALQNKTYYFRNILAVTFANKATQEMKDRILDYLDAFTKGSNDALATELKAELQQDDPTFRQNCAELLSDILHHYDQFSISTIDAFFQKVIRSFTREAGLTGDYRLEVDQDAVLEQVIDNLIDELVQNTELTHWVVEFARQNLENDKAWDVRNSLIEFSREIFREEFKRIQQEVRLDSSDPAFFSSLKNDLWKVKKSFLNSVSLPAKKVLETIASRGWKNTDLKFNGSGLLKLLHQFAHDTTLKDFTVPGSHFRDDFTNPKDWPKKDSLKYSEVLAEAELSLASHVQEMVALYDRDYKKALSVELVLNNLHAFGLLADIARKLQEYKSENNVMLLADAPAFLNGIIQDSDTPFIYEKIGSFYRNYLIDEFQDTSGFQWKNFLPLLSNGLDQGYPSLIVGDVKQAIYRWRSGDLTLLQREVEQHIGKERVAIKELDRNFRSGPQIILYNNAMFSALADIVAAETNSALPKDVYLDVKQKSAQGVEGFVRVNFIEADEDRKWKDVALEMLPRRIEELQLQGAALRDIAILVRTNAEGADIADFLLQYQKSAKAVPGCSYAVVSNESLRLTGAASINLLLGAMRYLLNADDTIARAQLSYEYAKLHVTARPMAEVFSVTSQVLFEGQLPEALVSQKLSLKKLPLFELTETLIQILDIREVEGELAYLQAFQDLVLEFFTRERNDLGSFLDWWEENKDKDKTSIKVSGEVEAVKILTIHKSKGLQFKYVLIPFCAWQVDHTAFQSPTLWVKSDQAPFDHMGYLPIKYASTLQHTVFNDFYMEERTRALLDNLNLLYVAFTRAEIGLIVTAPVPKGFSTVSNWVHQAITKHPDLLANWEPGKLQYAVGDVSIVGATSIVSVQPETLVRYSVDRWRDKLVIRQSGKSFFQEESSEKRTRINYGIQLHAILSRIRYAEDVHVTTEALVQEGFLISCEKAALLEQVKQLMAHPVVKGWFTPEWTVRTEVPILLPGGEENRIDRLLTKDGRAVIIDFKTGEKKKADQEQVSAYMDILRKMDFKEVEGYLLYVNELEVVAVHKSTGKVMKTKDDKQLGLF